MGHRQAIGVQGRGGEERGGTGVLIQGLVFRGGEKTGRVVVGGSMGSYPAGAWKYNFLEILGGARTSCV